MKSICDLKKETSGTSVIFRKLEILSLVLFALGFVLAANEIFLYLSGRIHFMIFCLFTSYVICDFLSGIVHWFADTWGSIQWPILGGSFIRSFREHHMHPLEITRHDFIETNGASALVNLPFLGICFFLDSQDIFGFMGVCLMAGISVFGFLTNQIHQWSHSAKVSQPVRWLQKKRIILSPSHHAGHHAGNLDQDYCITNGWLNRFLNRIQFFRQMEFVISSLTGAVPRAEDRVFLEPSQNTKAL